MADASMSSALKHDTGKPPLDLLDRYALEEIAQVLAFGVAKYGRGNWRKGFALSRLLAACLRHVFAFLDGEDLDPESGRSHLAHAACCLIFALRLHRDRPDLDDREARPLQPKLPTSTPPQLWPISTKSS